MLTPSRREFLLNRHRKGGINVFDINTGEIVEILGQSGQQEHRLQIPTNIAFDGDGYIYVMDTADSR